MKQRTQEEWKKLFEEYYSSEQKQSEWCKSHNVNLYTFRDRLSKAKKVKGPNCFEKIEKHETVDLSDDEVATQKSVEWLVVSPKDKRVVCEFDDIKVRVGGFTVLVQPRFNEATFMTVCKVLRSLC